MPPSANAGEKPVDLIPPPFTLIFTHIFYMRRVAGSFLMITATPLIVKFIRVFDISQTRHSPPQHLTARVPITGTAQVTSEFTKETYGLI